MLRHPRKSIAQNRPAHLIADFQGENIIPRWLITTGDVSSFHNLYWLLQFDVR